MLTKFPAAKVWLIFIALTACSTADFEESAEIMAEPALEEAPLADAIAPAPPMRRPFARAGVLTAGDIDDGLNRAAFQRYLKRTARQLRLPGAELQRPVALRMIGSDGAAAPGTRVTLRRPGAAEPFWSGYAGVDGRLVVYPGLFRTGSLRQVEVRAFSRSTQQAVNRTVTTGQWQDIDLPFESDWRPDFLDLVFVVDTTGSMADELDWLTRDLLRIVGAARKVAPGVDVRFGLIVYRDRGDAYVVRNFGFTESGRQMRRWLRAQDANGGGDYPEAAALALQAGAELNWRRGRGERLLFHVADAPPHRHRAGAYLEAARALARRDVQVFGLGASGVAAESEFLMRQAAAMNQGRYLFLTDDSGVGHGHSEPTISCYRVTRLSGLVRRVLQSELSGIRVEARMRDVIREVGSYDRGTCRN